MTDFEKRIAVARAAWRAAERIVVGAGAGLSAAAGLTYSERRFTRYFPDFCRKYGLTDMYAAMFYPYPSPEELWAHHARHVLINRFLPDTLPLYRRLLSLLDGRDYFVITTNVDGQFVKAGVPAERIFQVQGDYGLMQCAAGCHDKTYGNETLVREMVEATQQCAVPTALVPKCPVCGGPMALHIRTDGAFVEDDAWQAAYRAYTDFLRQSGKVVFLELGVGFNTPSIIRFPFEKAVSADENARLIRVNRDDAFCAAPRAVCFGEDIGEVLARL